MIITILTGMSYSQDYEAIQNAFNESYNYEYTGQYSKAIESLKSVYSENSYEINLRLGWLNYMGGFFTESLAYYQKAIDLQPLSIEAKLGYVYPASALGNWEQVKTQYNEILKIDPKNTTANYRLGSIYYGNEDYTSALKYFEKVVNLYPFDYSSLLMYAWTNLRLGKTREAKVLFNKVLMNKPGDESAMDGLNAID
ncbi:MAG: tetratricopeptide repeat protein [Bacteroidales bacterium]|nr:tetratricopeptide repeat protein [Bacteroidales bacterium]